MQGICLFDMRRHFNRFTSGLVGDAPMAGGICLPLTHQLVDLCLSRSNGNRPCFADRKLPGDKGCTRQPSQKFAGRLATCCERRSGYSNGMSLGNKTIFRYTLPILTFQVNGLQVIKTITDNTHSCDFSVGIIIGRFNNLSAIN